MITLQELFDTLSYGELSNLSIRQEHSNSLSDEQFPKIISHINLGLGKLYQRFNLYSESLYLHLHEDVTRYFLRSENAGLLVDISESIYIENTADKSFEDNLIKVTNVYDELEGQIFPSDGISSSLVKLVTVDTLDIDVGGLTPQKLTITYQASYPKIVITPTLNPSMYKLYISDTIIEALLFYVASRVYKPMGNNSSTADADKSDSYMQLYELACKRIEVDATALEVVEQNDTFQNGGFV